MPQFKIKGLKDFQKAIKQNPRVVKDEVGDFFTDAMRSYNKLIIRNPWRIGGSRGGAPVDTGHLRDTHKRWIGNWQAKIWPTAEYAYAVHEGTWKMEARPWLDYVFQEALPEIKRREREMLNNIVNDLAYGK